MEGGGVSAGCIYTASAGIFALEQGGNAIDAAIAAQLMAVVILFIYSICYLTNMIISVSANL